MSPSSATCWNHYFRSPGIGHDFSEIAPSTTTAAECLPFKSCPFATYLFFRLQGRDF